MDLPFVKLQKEIIERQKLSKEDKDNDGSDLVEEKWVEETWIESLLEKYPDCPNPTNYPRAALYYLINRKKP